MGHSTNNIVIAHRGAWKKQQHPQNSIAALRAAIELNCIGSEFDVRMTTDGVLIVVHDEIHEGLLVEQSNYQDLLQHPFPNGESLPTLKEYLLSGIENNTTTQLICEIKPSTISPAKGIVSAEKAINLVLELGLLDRVVFISFDYAILLQILSIYPQAKTQYLEHDKLPDELIRDGISGADYDIDYYLLNPSFITEAKAQGLVLNAWTVNDEDKMRKLIAYEFDYISTDEPELLFRILEEKNN